jgi:hypothetical protein
LWGTAVAVFHETRLHALLALGKEEGVMAITDPKKDIVPPGVASSVAMPPAPPGESSPAAVDRTRAVSEALARLGDEADARQLADRVRATWGLTLSVDDIETIRHELLAHALPAAPAEGASGKGGGS